MKTSIWCNRSNANFSAECPIGDCCSHCMYDRYSADAVCYLEKIEVNPQLAENPKLDYQQRAAQAYRHDLKRKAGA